MNGSDPPTGPTRGQPSPPRSAPGDAWSQARAEWRAGEPPAALEATLLARFGEMRAQREKPDEGQNPPVDDAPRAGWRRLFALTRLHPALTGALSFGVVLAFAAPWWLQWMTATPESTTPFMLVSEPSGGQLNVAQMVRVSVAREAMLDFGIPVPPQRLQEPVRAEMLLGPRGEMLAVRFIEAPVKKRWSFD